MMQLFVIIRHMKKTIGGTADNITKIMWFDRGTPGNWGFISSPMGILSSFENEVKLCD